MNVHSRCPQYIDFWVFLAHFFFFIFLVQASTVIYWGGNLSSFFICIAYGHQIILSIGVHVGFCFFLALVG